MSFDTAIMRAQSPPFKTMRARSLALNEHTPYLDSFNAAARACVYKFHFNTIYKSPPPPSPPPPPPQPPPVFWSPQSRA